MSRLSSSLQSRWELSDPRWGAHVLFILVYSWQFRAVSWLGSL